MPVANSFIAGASMICRTLASLSNSLAASSAKQALEIPTELLQARRIAANVAKLPELLRKGRSDQN
jgi:hypothetical protein